MDPFKHEPHSNTNSYGEAKYRFSTHVSLLKDLLDTLKPTDAPYFPRGGAPVPTDTTAEPGTLQDWTWKMWIQNSLLVLIAVLGLVAILGTIYWCCWTIRFYRTTFVPCHMPQSESAREIYTLTMEDEQEDEVFPLKKAKRNRQSTEYQKLAPGNEMYI